tara:strand:+ start:3226 stop:4383 length:1158 start_codon:yes stop_codon:yes gene_type:complete
MENKIYTKSYLILALSTFAFFMSFHMLLPILSPYSQQLGAKENEIGIIVGIFAVVSVLARIPYGSYADRHFKKNLLLLGAFIFTISPILYTLSSSPGGLMFSRIIHGLGIGAFTIASMAMVTELSPKNRLGEAMGVYGTSIMAAMAIAPGLSGYLVDSIGFNNTFYVASIFGVVSLCLASLIKKTQPAHNHAPILINLKETIANKRVILASFGIFFLTVSYGVVVTFIPVYQLHLGMNYSMIGKLFTVAAITTIITRPIIGKLSDKTGRMKIILPLMILTIGGIYSASIFTSIEGFYFFAVIYSLGFGSSYTILSAMVADNAKPKNRGMAMAIFTSHFDLGIAVGAIGIGLIASSVEYSGLFKVTTLILVLGTLIFATLSLKLKN